MAKSPSFSSPARLLVTALIALPAVVGLGFLVAGVLAVTQGHSESWPAAVLGAQLAVLGVLGVLAMRPNRADPPPAQQAGVAVALPLRGGFVPAQAAVAVVLGTLPMPVALADGGAGRVVASVALLAGLAAATWVLTKGADAARVVLDPEGLRVPAGWGTTGRLEWGRIEGAQAVPRWQPLLVVIPKGDRTPLGVRLLPQAWSPEALTALIEHYAEHPADRAGLTDPAVVERFRRI